MATPNEPLLHKASNRGYINEKVKPGKYKRHYLPGPYKSQEMWAAWESYKQQQQDAAIQAEIAHHRAAGDNHGQRATFASTSGPATVQEICLRYLAITQKRRHHGQQKQGEADKAAIGAVDRAIKMLSPFFHMLAEDFTADQLRQARQIEISTTGNGRKTINGKIAQVIRIFRSAEAGNRVSNDCVSRLIAFRSTETLNHVDNDIPGPVDVPAACPDAVAELITHAPPTIAAMVAVQAATGMRSANVCTMKWCEIDKSRYDASGVWIYKPAHHKTKHKNKTLSVPLGPRSIEALMQYHNIRPDREHEYIFNPRAARSWRYFSDYSSELPKAQGVAARILKRLQKGPATGDQLAKIKRWYSGALHRLRNLGYTITRDAAANKRSPSLFTLTGYEQPADRARSWQDFYKSSKQNGVGLCYSATTYGKAVKRLQERGGLERFTPHQLRHLHNQRVLESYGIKEAQAVLGHTTIGMTLNYSTQDLKRAVKVQQHVG